jgi:hypothetical protein
MTNNLTDKLTPYEEFLIEAAEDNTNRYSRKSVQLVVQNGIGDYVYTVFVPEKWKESELAKMIGAKKIQKYNIHSKRVEKSREKPADKELVNRKEYLVIGDNIPDIKKRIQDYKDKHETFAHANNTNRALDLINNYKYED